MTDLIVNDVRPRVQFEQTVGGAVSFDLPFPALAADHVRVSVDGGPANAEPYSVENLGQTGGARIVFAIAPPLGARIAVWREAPVERLTDFADDGTFRAKALNQELDRITLLLQELHAGAGDAVRKPPSDADLDLTLPSAASRANRFLSFDAEGKPDASAAVESIGFVHENLADIRNYAETYLGAHANDPIARNDGAPLQDGDLYFNTTVNRMRIRDATGGTWIDAFASNPDYLLRDGSNSGPLSARRNLLMNADGLVHQRGDFASGVASGYAGPDRWKIAQVGSAVFNVSSNSDVPTGYTGRSLTLQASVAITPGASDYVGYQQVLEGQFLQHLNFGAANARPLVLSFWVKASVAGTYVAELFNADASPARHICKPFTVDASGVWEYKTIQFHGDAAAGFDISNDDSLYVIWNLVAGSDFTGGTQAETWRPFANANRAAAGMANAFGTVGNAFQIFRPQLEPGPVATPFEHVPYAQSLAECQRYYVRLDSVIVEGGGSNVQSVFLPAAMRAPPTWTGGGAGFTPAGFAAGQVSGHFFQTTRATQNLRADAEL
ncbi:MAG: hypothetical protein NXI21_17320 [Alphaproteobacteria bacterium]|nr:hypothetical protein [Alphaproteobacteria bacterium]